MSNLLNIQSDYDTTVQVVKDTIRAQNDLGLSLFPSEIGTLLAEVQAGLTAMTNYKLTTAVSNTFLPTAISRDAIYKMGSTLGNSPRRKIGASTTLTLTITSAPASNVSIPAGTQFDLNGMLWYTKEVYVITPATTTLDIVVYQGEIKTTTFTGNSQTFQVYEFGENFNVDYNSVTVTISGVEWTKNRDYYDLDNVDNTDQNIYIETTNSQGKVQLKFGNGTYGNVPVLNIDINVEYVETLGSGSNFANLNQTASIVTSLTGVTFTAENTTVASGGDDQETPDEVRFTSPRLYSANRRAVTRNDFVALIQKRGGFIASQFWGEYEESLRRGITDLTLMNQYFFTVLPEDAEIVSGSLPSITSSSTYTPTLTEVPIIPGSVRINIGDLYTYYDYNGILTSNEVSTFNEITGATALNTDASSQKTSYPAVNAFDQDRQTYYQSDDVPTEESTILVGYKFSASQQVTSLRIQAADILDDDSRGSPKYVTILGSNSETVDITDRTDFDVLKGRTEIRELSVRENSDWIILDTVTPVKWIVVEVSETYDGGVLSIGNVQAQVLADTSTIDYTTGAVSITLPTSVTEDVTYSVMTPDASSVTTSDLIDYLDTVKAPNTEITYQSPIARPFDIDMEVYYTNTVDDPNALKGVIKSDLESLLTPIINSFSKSVEISDIIRSVEDQVGVDYVKLKSPKTSIVVTTKEFAKLYTTTVTMIKSNRSVY